MGQDSRATSQAGSAAKWLAALAVLGAVGIGIWRLDRDGKRDERSAPRSPAPPITVAPPEPAPAPVPAPIAVASEVEPAPLAVEPEPPEVEPAPAVEPEPPDVEASSHSPRSPPAPKPDELNCLLSPDAPGCPNAAASPAPEDQPSRTEVLAGVTKLKPAMARCHDKYKVDGSLRVKFVIAPTGRVTVSEAAGDLGGTASADCVTKAFRGMRFEPFSGARMTVVFPVVLR